MGHGLETHRHPGRDRHRRRWNRGRHRRTLRGPQTQYAARKIRRAVEAGQFTLTITWPAKLLLRAQAMFPEVTRHLMAGVNEYVLPHPEGSKTLIAGRLLNESFKGVFRLFTTLGRSAASELNQG